VAQAEIKSVLRAGWNFTSDTIPDNVSDAVDRWKLKLRLSAAILKKVLVEGGEKTSKELFLALSAVNGNGRPEETLAAALAADSSETAETYSIFTSESTLVNSNATQSSISLSTFCSREEGNTQDGKNLLDFLISQLK
jgi:hypothetical protein